MGDEKTYPGFLLPLTVCQEVAIVLSLFLDLPVSLFLVSIFWGGILHVQIQPNGPLNQRGMVALVPFIFLTLAAQKLILWITHERDVVSLLGDQPSIWVFVAGMALGITSGAFLVWVHYSAWVGIHTRPDRHIQPHLLLSFANGLSRMAYTFY